MENISDKIEQEILTAAKNKDEARLSLFRMVKAAIKNKEIEKGATLGDKEISEVLKKEAKKRKEAEEAFAKGGREDLAQKEKNESDMLAPYLPVSKTEDEIKTIVASVISETEGASMSDMGKIIKTVMEKAGGEAEGSIVSRLVKESLSK
ncbi:GatB/YqeY domain-containing protein [Candidatus Microgenomates bacterium]|nr:GatB/YqeY domain-containing protein [Candidatus Microgenomates bacterium]